MNRSLFRATAFSLSLFAGLASAQQVSTGALASSANSELDEVVVTATRRAESTEKIPISIEALGQKDLAENGVKGIGDLAAMVPGLQFQANGFSLYSNYTTVAIRGLNSIVGPSTVGIYLDDAPLQGRMSAIGNVGFIFPLVFDLDRVEVARGPQGTLFGASAESGTLRFITRQPSLTDYSGYTHEEIASTDHGALSYEIGAAGGGPIIDDQVGFRVSAWYRRDGGFVDRVDPTTGDIIDRNANSDSKGAVRGALAIKVNDDVLITPALYYQYADVNNNSLFYPIFSDPQNGEFANGRLSPDRSVEHLVVPSVKVEAPLSLADLTVTSSYVSRHFNENLPVESLICSIYQNCGSPLGIAYPSSYSDAAPSNTGQVMIGSSQEVRFTSKDPSAVITWVAGVFHDHRNQTDYQTGLAPAMDTGPAGNPLYYIDQTIVDDQIALFGQGDYHFAYGWTATLGARIEEAKANQINFNGPGEFNSGEPLFAISPTLKEHPILPKFAVSYQANANDLFYASVAKGLRIGGGNNGLPSACPQVASRSFNDDYVWSYEVGAKNKLFDGRVQIDTSVFHANWYQLQGTVLLPCGLSYVTNLGSAVDNGFDMAFAALLTDRLRFDLNVGYADLKYSSNVYSSAGQPIALKGEAIQALGFVNPPWDAAATLSYSFPLPNGDEVHVRGQYIYHSHNSSPLISQVPSSPSYLPLQVADPATRLVNARAGYDVGNASFELFVNNLLNSHPLLNAYQDEANSNLVTYSTFRPRTVGLSANWKFK